MKNILNEVERIKDRLEAINMEMHQFYMRLDDEEKLSTEGFNIIYQTASLTNILAILEETFDQ